MANNPDGFGKAHSLMEVWFPGREYPMAEEPQGHSYHRICGQKNDPGQ